MAVYKDEAKGTWRVIYRYTDWTGKPKQTQKRGFKTKRDEEGIQTGYDLRQLLRAV